MNQKKLQVWLPLLLSVAVFIGMFFGYKLKDNMGQYAPSFFSKQKRTPLQEILELVQSKYVDTVNTDSLGYLAVQNVLSQLDPHSVYIPTEQVLAVNEDLQGSFEGVGIEFELMNDTVTVLKLFSKGPAEIAGIQVGDKLIKANDTLISGSKMAESKIKKQFRGSKGTTVKVMLLRNKQKMELVIKRGVIPVKSVDVAYMIEPGIAFVRLNKFAGNTYEEFMKNLERLKGEGMKKLILDLRDNGGGMLDDAIQIADEFLNDSKEIVYTEGKSSPRQNYAARRPGMFEEGTLILLIDEGSASASEVLAGALQDWDRATIVGRRSFGKGLVQDQFLLSDGSALRLTVSRYYTPIGRSIQKPYTRGNSNKYEEEISNRYANGNLFQNDSANHKGKAYKTKSGRTVFGGGGISPDVFVAADSTEIYLHKNYTYFKEALLKTAFTYFILSKEKLLPLKTPQALLKSIKEENTLWQLFETNISKTNFSAVVFTPLQKQFIETQLQAMIARLLWNTEGYFKIYNLSDFVVQKAVTIAKQ